MSYSAMKTITIPAQESQTSAIMALASALAEALGAELDSSGKAVIVDSENGMGFKFLASGSTSVGIVMMNSLKVDSVQQAIAFNAPMMIDYCTYDGTIAVGLRAASGTPLCGSIYAKTQDGEPVCLRITGNSTAVPILGKSHSGTVSLYVMINRNSSVIAVQRLCSVFWNSLFDNLYNVTSGGSGLTFNSVLEANGKHFQVLTSSSSSSNTSYPVLAMRID